jgi:hypothetical protein
VKALNISTYQGNQQAHSLKPAFICGEQKHGDADRYGTSYKAKLAGVAHLA